MSTFGQIYRVRFRRRDCDLEATVEVAALTQESAARYAVSEHGFRDEVWELVSAEVRGSFADTFDSLRRI